MAVPTAAIPAHRLVGTRLVEAVAVEVGHGRGRAQPPGPGRQRLRCEALRPHPQRKLCHGARALEEEVTLRQQQRVEQHVLPSEITPPPPPLAERILAVHHALAPPHQPPLERTPLHAALTGALTAAAAVSPFHPLKVGINEYGVGFRRHLSAHDLVGAPHVHSEDVTAAAAPGTEDLERSRPQLGPHQIGAEVSEQGVRYGTRTTQAVPVVRVGAAVAGDRALVGNDVHRTHLQGAHPPAPYRRGAEPVAARLTEPVLPCVLSMRWTVVGGARVLTGLRFHEGVGSQEDEGLHPQLPRVVQLVEDPFEQREQAVA
eukprot:scaffold8514_cov55-Phaeocystis_antarctica.AAC.9